MNYGEHAHTRKDFGLGRVNSMSVHLTNRKMEEHGESKQRVAEGNMAIFVLNRLKENCGFLPCGPLLGYLA
jgi:hypothetical protein